MTRRSEIFAKVTGAERVGDEIVVHVSFEDTLSGTIVLDGKGLFLRAGIALEAIAETYGRRHELEERAPGIGRAAADHFIACVAMVAARHSQLSGLLTIGD